MKILILGCTGMLGNAVAKYLKSYYTIDGTYRSNNIDQLKSSINIHNYIKIDFNNEIKEKLEYIESLNYDYIINCIGIIKPLVNQNVSKTIYINSYLPHLFSEKFGNFIHITTDCVFDGKIGNYTESSIHSELDLYGLSKSIGEPKDCMVLRTSIIGEELHNNNSLIEWAKSQKGKKIFGYKNHLWNGVTTNQCGHIIKNIISNKLYENKLFHVHSPNDINKYELLELINDRFDLGLDIHEHLSDQSINRTLRSELTLCDKLKVPTISKQILDM